MEATVREVADGKYEVIVTARAVDDTVAIAHYRGANVAFLDLLWKDSEVWNNAPVSVYLTEGVYNDREAVTPPLHIVGRGNLPPVPTYLKINDQFGHNVWADQDVVVKIVARGRAGNVIDSGQVSRVKLTTIDNTVIAVRNVTPPASPTGEHFAEQTITFSGLVIESAIGKNLATLEVTVDSVWDNRQSWQRWQSRIDWANYDRSGQRQGWNFDWGNDWGGGDASGWGYDFDENYGD